MNIKCTAKLTLVVFVDHNHTTVAETAAGWRVTACDIAAFNVLWHRCGHVHGLYEWKEMINQD